jgi:Delta3-Delta2-enoyl-CoA isomerase
MYKPNVKRMREFWFNLQGVWMKLYGSSFPTAAAIHGHSPAGGCLFSMSCEYRVMCPKFTIGLNETKLGIVAPWWFMSTMKNCISHRDAELALTLGTMFTTDEALRIGLIDEIATDKADAIAKCEKFLLNFQKINPNARKSTKMTLRGADIKQLEANREADIDVFANFVTQKDIQKSLGLYMGVMKARKVMKNLMNPIGFVKSLFKSEKSNKKKTS